METVAPFELVEGADLHAIHNESDDDYHRAEITLRVLKECKLRAELKKLHYGRVGNDEAALVIFEFNFIKSDKIRYKSAAICIAFDSNDGQSAVPEVYDLFPSTVYGIVAEDKRHWNWNASLGLTTPVGINSQVGVARDSEITVAHRMTIRGDKYSTRPSRRPNNAVEWKLEENRAQEAGIPHKFFCAAIVQHHGRKFKGEVKVKVTLGVRKWYDPFAGSQAWIMQAWPWEMDDPILFNPKTSVGNLALSGDIDLATLTEEERMQLTPLVEEYEVGSVDHHQLILEPMEFSCSTSDPATVIVKYLSTYCLLSIMERREVNQFVL
jgi:hypothetical protein